VSYFVCLLLNNVYLARWEEVSSVKNKSYFYALCIVVDIVSSETSATSTVLYVYGTVLWSFISACWGNFWIKTDAGEGTGKKGKRSPNTAHCIKYILSFHPRTVQ
jgi:hypothetical protein